MSERRGVLSAGTWCVDFNKSIARWPDEDTSNEVFAIDRQNGGSGSNMALDLKRLDPELPVEAMGGVGRDDERRCFQCRDQRPAHPFLSSGRGGRDDARRLRFFVYGRENSASWIAGSA